MIKASVYSQGAVIWVSSTCFQKSNIAWPQQPPTEKVPNISEKLDFWWSIPQRGTSIGHFGARNDQTIMIRNLLEEIGLVRLVRPTRLPRLLRSMRLQRFLGSWKSLLRTSESSRFLNSMIKGQILMFWKKIFFDIIMKIPLNFSNFSFGGWWGLPMSLFLKTGWWNSNDRTSGIHRCLYHNQKVVFRWPPRSSKYIKAIRNTLYSSIQSYLLWLSTTLAYMPKKALTILEKDFTKKPFIYDTPV